MTAAPARLHRYCTVQLQSNSVQLAEIWCNCVQTSMFLCNSTWAKRVRRVVASGTPVGLAGAVPWSCVRGARGRFGGLGPVPGVVSSPSPPSRAACPALCMAGGPVRLSLTLAQWYAIPCGLCVPRARSRLPSGFPRVSFVCVCARAPAASTPASPPSPGWCGTGTSRGPGAGRW